MSGRAQVIMACATTGGSQPELKGASPGRATMAAHSYTSAEIDAGFEAATRLDRQCLAESDLDAMIKLGQLKDLMKAIDGKCGPTEEVKIIAACVRQWKSPHLESFASTAAANASGETASVMVRTASSEIPQEQSGLQHLSEKVHERIAANREEAKRRRLHTICQTAGLHINT